MFKIIVIKLISHGHNRQDFRGQHTLFDDNFIKASEAILIIPSYACLCPYSRIFIGVFLLRNFFKVRMLSTPECGANTKFVIRFIHIYLFLVTYIQIPKKRICIHYQLAYLLKSVEKTFPTIFYFLCLNSVTYNNSRQNDKVRSGAKIFAFPKQRTDQILSFLQLLNFQI